MISSAGSTGYASYLNQLSLTQSTSTGRKTSTDENSISVTSGSNTSSADEVVISDEAYQLMESLASAEGSEKPSGPPPGGPPPGGKPPEGMGSFTEEIEETQTAFNEALAAALEEAGIDAEGVEVGYDEDGNLVVTSDMDAEEKAVVDALLAEDTELAQAYAELQEMKDAAAAMEEMMAQGPPQGMMGGQGQMQQNWMAGGQVVTPASAASMYATQSTTASNSGTIQVTT